MRIAAILTAIVIAGTAIAAVAAPPAQQAIIDQFAAAAKKADPGFSGFSPDAGKTFFFAEQTGGTGEASNCYACHGKDPKKAGETRAGQTIDPIAVSVNPKRFTDMAMVEKWFGRNCDTVLGRECTVVEKGNFLTFMSAQ